MQTRRGVVIGDPGASLPSTGRPGVNSKGGRTISLYLIFASTLFALVIISMVVFPSPSPPSVQDFQVKGPSTAGTFDVLDLSGTIHDQHSIGERQNEVTREHLSPSPPCHTRRNCLSCLFDRRGENEQRSAETAASSKYLTQPSFSLNKVCAWCASSNQCVPVAGSHPAYGGGSKHSKSRNSNASSRVGTADETACGDLEERSCPAVLHDLLPSAHRVTHVAIRKGGPEALIQLFLALSFWGYRTTLDTRQSKKQKGGDVVPFFKEAYRTEFAAAPPLRWVKNYDDWHRKASDGDVLIATETWECKKYQDKVTNVDSAMGGSGAVDVGEGGGHILPHRIEFYSPASRSGARQMQWHLTVWARKDRSECTIAGHTNFVTKAYMRQSKRALLFPFISPHILRLADEKRAYTAQQNKMLVDLKQDLVLYDSDTKLRDADLSPIPNLPHDTKIATGYTPQQLYDLYVKAKVGIDLRLPGGERFIYEAALFDVCVIVDASLNGGDAEDFPIPEEFRVLSAIPVGQPSGPPSTAFLADLNRAKNLCLERYSSNDIETRRALVASFEPLRQHVRHQKVAFHRHVRRYFSNSIHIVTAALTKSDAEKWVIPFILATLFQMPFATIEVVFVSQDVRNSVPQSGIESLKTNSLMAAVTFRVLRRGGSRQRPEPTADDDDDAKQGGARNPSALLAKKMHDTVDLLLDNPIVSAGGGGDMLGQNNHELEARVPFPFSLSSPKRQLYTAVLPISAATGFDGDFAHFLGSLLTIEEGSKEKTTKPKKEGNAQNKVCATSSLHMSQEEWRLKLQSENIAGAPAFNSRGLAPECSEQRSSNGGGSPRGAAVVFGSTSKGQSKQHVHAAAASESIIGLFWRTADTTQAVESMTRLFRSHLIGLGGNNQNGNYPLPEPDAFRFIAVLSVHHGIPRKLSESEYYSNSNEKRSLEESFSDELVIPLDSVLSGMPPTEDSGPHGEGGAAATLHAFLCEHELWQREGARGGGCPNRIPDAPAGPAA